MKVPLLDLRGQYASLRTEIRAVIDQVCDAQALILGAHVERFERNLAAYCGTQFAIGLSSGTDALLCAMMAIDIRPGDEIICPSFTFFATAGSIARLGAVPVFVDILPDTFNLDPDAVRSRITSKTRAILPVHLFGQTADMDSINAIAAGHGIKVLEDAAQAIGARRHGKPACSLSLAGCLSFYPTKNLGALGDAGAICSSDPDFIEKCRLIRVHGSAHTYHHKLIGANFRIDAIQAAVLDVKLKYLDTWHNARRANAALYDKLLTGSPVTTPEISPGNQSIYNQYVVRVPNRDAVQKSLAQRGIGSAVYYPIPLHLQECFAYLGHKPGDFPITEQACHEVLALPVYPELLPEQIEYVAEQLLEIVAQPA